MNLVLGPDQGDSLDSRHSGPQRVKEQVPGALFRGISSDVNLQPVPNPFLMTVISVAGMNRPRIPMVTFRMHSLGGLCLQQ